jgi:large subunit ribosomal protein L25
MRTVSMSGSLRESVGKRDAKKHRKLGEVPCVLYGGKDQIHFAADVKAFKHIVYTPEACFVKLNLNGKEVDSILQDIQFHPVTDNIMHADFLELVAGKTIIMNIPIKTEGIAPGILKGGKLIQKYRKLKIKALPEKMPEAIIVNIDSLEIGISIKVSELGNENYTILDPQSSVVATVRVTRATEEPVAGATEEAAKAPEAAK